MEAQTRQFERRLADLKSRLLLMAATAEAMLDEAIAALVNRNEDLAVRVPEYENNLNRMQVEIDDVVAALIATHQPVAVDLRFVIAVTRINSELERIGDLVVNILESVPVLVNLPPLKPLIDIPRMAVLARRMVNRGLDAFVKGDASLAEAVIRSDDEIDALKDQVLRELLTYMMADAHAIERALHLILVSRHLERIGDHATNIAEDVIYLVQGRDARHPRTPRADEAPSA